MNAIALWPHFLRPDWLWALTALPLLLAWWWRRSDATAVWRRAVDPHLLPALLEGAPPRRRHLGALWLLLAYSLAVCALAGPAWRQQPAETWRSESPLVVALELSQAMLAADQPPSRLLRARLKLAQLLELRQGGQVALLAYADDAYTVAPLTEDAATVRGLLDALDPTVMPADGRRADRAIAQARALLANAGYAHGDVLLIASAVDGDAVGAAAAAQAGGVRVSVLGIGTAEGAPVRLADGGFLDAPDGSLRIERMDADALRAVAAASDGRFAALDAGDADLRALGVLDPDAGLARAGDSDALRWRDEGYWLLLALLPLALLGFRRGALAGLVLAVSVLAPAPAQAFDWEALWRRDDQRAWQALQDGDAAAARSLARDPALAGAAAYRQQDWDGAIAAWSQRDDAASHYNRGNALAQAQRYDEALRAYDEALRRDPGLADAAANRDAVREWLERQPPQQPQGEGEGPPKDGQEGEPGEGQEQAPGAPGGEPSPQAPGEPGEGEPETSAPEDAGGAEPSQEDAAAAEQAMREALQQALESGQDGQRDGEAQADPGAMAEEEQRRAVEQWLRRVPDDPGGLLRRKFALEHQRRQSEGNPRR